MSSISRISRGLFIGDYDASQDINKLSQLGITSLVSASQYSPYSPSPFSLPLSPVRQHYDTTLDILRIPVDDSPSANLIQHFPAARRFIRAALDKGDGVLVHCQAGVSRSATLVAAYLMAQEPGIDVDQALASIRKVRPQVEPTETFLHQLEMYERCECEWDPVKVSAELPRC
jgi:dual specificity phosphatase 12